MSARRQWVFILAASITATLAAVPAARACGGFFCAQNPVDQTAEQIIFLVNGDGTITAHVQIQYSGDRDGFAWVVPVPTTPVLATFPRLAFRTLAQQTQPAYQAQCGGRTIEGGSQFGNGVVIYNQQSVGPYDTVTIGGDTGKQLVDWLQGNGYLVTDQMTPYIDGYAKAKMLFLAMKLKASAMVSDIEPVVMTYRSTKPMIPIRLTAVAAQPEMGIVTWILADRRYGPENYAEVTISDDLVQFGGPTGNNYRHVVSREVHAHGGHAFVTEYAGPTQPLAQVIENTFAAPDSDLAKANAALVALLRKQPYVTRLYTRMSAEQMTEDPVFTVASSQVDVSNVHPINQRDRCFSAALCDFTTCGPHGQCMPTPSGVGCWCDPSATARSTNTFGGNDVTCETMTADLLGQHDPSAAQEGNPCLGFDCGLGTCVTINDVPTCQCMTGYIAVPFATRPDAGPSQSAIRCVSPLHDSPDAGLHFTPLDAAPAPDAATARVAPATDGCDCRVGGHRRASGLSLLVVLAALLLRRRR
jgi:MYXO-CTERM domain-containing protein